jgi:hypothetical protein
MMVKRTGLMVSALGAQELIDDADVKRLRDQRREDIEGAPLVWRVALENLLKQVSGSGN